MPQYKVIEAKSIKLLEEKLNAEAKQGFELVTVFSFETRYFGAVLVKKDSTQTQGNR
jgi:hypothetical protein